PGVRGQLLAKKQVTLDGAQKAIAESDEKIQNLRKLHPTPMATASLIGLNRDEIQQFNNYKEALDGAGPHEVRNFANKALFSYEPAAGAAALRALENLGPDDRKMAAYEPSDFADAFAGERWKAIDNASKLSALNRDHANASLHAARRGEVVPAETHVELGMRAAEILKDQNGEDEDDDLNLDAPV